MSMYKEISNRIGIAVYFCDPHNPWQRGSNENMSDSYASIYPRVRA